MNEKHAKLAMKVCIHIMIANAALSILKIIAGLLSGSYALVSDAINSGSDVFVSLVVIIGVKAASKKADEKHPYGHERFENITALILAMFIAVAGLGTGYAGLETLINGTYPEVTEFTVFALIAAVVSIAAKEGMFWYTRAAAIKCNSDALKADAWNHRSDTIASFGSVIGIVGTMLGLPILDPIAGIIICILIVITAVSIFKSSISKMTDQSVPEELQNEMKACILNNKDVLEINALKTRMFGNKIYADVEISINEKTSFVISHEIVTTVHDELEKTFPALKHCTVHANPKKIEQPSAPKKKTKKQAS